MTEQPYNAYEAHGKIQTGTVYRVTVTFDVRAEDEESALQVVQECVDDMPAWDGGPIVDRMIRTVE